MWLRDYITSRQWFGMGRCRICGHWSWAWILKSESAHESCWLLEK